MLGFILFILLLLILFGIFFMDEGAFWFIVLIIELLDD